MLDRAREVLNANRITAGQFWWFMLLAFLVAPTALSLADLALYRFTGNETYAPIRMEYGSIGPIVAVSMRFATGPLATVGFWLAVIPAIVAAVRRLHDTNRSGAWLLLLLVPIVGWFVLLVWWTNRSDPVANAYGPVPAAPGGGARSAILAVALAATSIAAWFWMMQVTRPAPPPKPAISAQASVPSRPTDA